MKKLITLILMVLILGCSNQKVENKPKTNEHEHKPGQKGGYIIEIGRDDYHAEVVVENDTLKMFMLDTNEEDIAIELQSLTAYAQAGMGEKQQFKLDSAPLAKDKSGTTSLLVGKLPKELAGKSLTILIPNIRINKERFRVEFELSSDVVSDDEKTLFLTAGGKYTKDDIIANGNMTCSQKFRNFKPKHDLRPKPGAKICPITLTKANPQCTWIVGGKTYEFCCPPCIEEFVKMAKEEPNKIEEPDFYVK